MGIDNVHRRRAVPGSPPMNGHARLRPGAAGATPSVASSLICGCLVGACLVALAGTAASEPAPAGPEPALVDVAQHAMLERSPTDTRRIWVVRLEPDVLVYKEADHADAEQRLVARTDVKAGVKLLSGEVFRIDPRRGRFNRFDVLTGRFAPLHAAGEPAGTVTAGDSGDGRGEIHTEVAEGTGTDAAAALADAFRNAVRQAVGVYVDSETLTDKEEIVADKVLTFSDAFIVRYEEISRSTDAGLVTIKISAAIQAGKLMTNLREAKVNTLELSGGDLVASALTRKEAKDTAADLLFKKLCELPGALEAEALPFKTLDYDARKSLLTVTYTLHADREHYKAFLKSIQPLLTQTAVAKTSIVVKVDPIWSDNSAPVWQDDSSKRRLVAAQAVFTPGFRYGPNLASYPDTWCLWLMTRWDANHRNTQWQGFALDIDLPRAFREPTGSMQVKLELLDGQGEVVKTESHDPLEGLERPAYWFGWARPRPRQFSSQNPKSWPALGDCPTEPILLVTFREPQFAIDRQRAVNVYVSPMCYSVANTGPPVLSPGAWRVCQIPIEPDALARVAKIRATPVFVPANPAPSTPASPVPDATTTPKENR